MKCNQGLNDHSSTGKWIGLDQSIMDICHRHHHYNYYYRRPKYSNNNNNNNINRKIIESCNINTSQYRNKLIAIKHTDIIIYATISFYYAPAKRKIDTKKVFGKKLTGRNNYKYDEDSNTFYLDNKLMVIKHISNRAIKVKNLIFHHHDGRMLTVENSNNSEEGLCIKTIKDKFLQFCQGKFPKNIITFCPIVCEFFHFLITNFCHNPTTNITLHFVLSNLKNNNSSSNIFSNLKKTRHDVKIRIAMKNNNYNNNNNNTAVAINPTNITSTIVNKKDYLFQDQFLLIRDYSPYENPKIYINIPAKCIESKYYFVKNATINEFKSESAFVCNNFCKRLNNEINKYFNPSIG